MEEKLTEIYSEVQSKMDKSLENLGMEFSSIRSMRAHPSLLENIKVEAYSQVMPLKNLASVAVQDSTTLTVTVWDQGLVSVIDKAIRAANMGLNPRLEGNKMFVPLPPVTTERRQEFIKLAKQKAEASRVSIRNIRRQYNDDLKKMEKDGEISEDIMESALKKIQQLTDSHINQIENTLREKEKDLIGN